MVDATQIVTKGNAHQWCCQRAWHGSKKEINNSLITIIMIWIWNCIIQPLPTGEHVHMFSLHLDLSHSLLFGASHFLWEENHSAWDTATGHVCCLCPSPTFMNGISWTEATRWSNNNHEIQYPIHIKGGLFIWRPCLCNSPQGLHCCLCLLSQECFSCIYHQQQNIWLVSLIKFF